MPGPEEGRETQQATTLQFTDAEAWSGAPQ